jgi:hypothetical protein
MLRRILVIAVMALASCQSLALSPALDENSTEDANPTGTTWMETEMNGVHIGMRVPSGWAADINSGLLLAEHTSSMDTSEVEVAVLIRIFVPSLDNIPHSQIIEAENAALALLDQVVNMPSVIGQHVVVSEPVSFNWDGHEAAYYLLSDVYGVKTIVIAVEAPEDQFVVCNIGMPPSEAPRVREMLPEVLDGLQIDGVAMDGESLDALPSPLEFPVYDQSPNTVPTMIQ